MCHGVRLSMNFPESALGRQNKQASQDSCLHTVWMCDRQEECPRMGEERHSAGFKNSEYYLLAGNNQVMDSPTAVMADESKEFGGAEANGNHLHHQQPPPAEELGEDHHHDPTMAPEDLLQQLNIKDGLVDDDADDVDTDAVQVAAVDSSAASDHGVHQGDHHAHDNPCRHLQEPAAAAAAADDVEIAPNIHLAHLSREFVEFIMSREVEEFIMSIALEDD